jgi:hypothetical protein
MIEQYGEVKYFDGKQIHKREMTDEELKCMMGNIQLNRGFSLPDQLLNDFMIGGPSKPTMKNCIHFNKDDFKNIVEPLKHKNIRKSYPKIKSKKRKQEKKQDKKKDEKINKKTTEKTTEKELSPTIKKKKSTKNSTKKTMKKMTKK